MSLFSLNETQLAVRSTAREFARRRIAPQARENDAYERFPADLLKEMAELDAHLRDYETANWQEAVTVEPPPLPE